MRDEDLDAIRDANNQDANDVDDVDDERAGENVNLTDGDITPIAAARQRAQRPATVTAPPVTPALMPPHPGRRDDGTGYRPTEVGTALRFANLHRNRLRYVPAWGWLAWNVRRWRRDETGAVEWDAARATLAAVCAEVAAGAATGVPDLALLKHVTEISRGNGLDHVIKLARTEAGIVAAPDVFDRDRFAITVENGTIDLRTGALHPHNPTDLITCLAPVAYNPSAAAPMFEAFLARVLPDPAVRTWVQRYLGYALTGDVREQCLAFFVGEGANGKSVLLDTLLAVLGDYGFRAAPDLVLASHSERHPTEIADLAGRRLVVCSEIEQGRGWAESTLKRLTGDATITARRMRRDFFTFTATHKLVIAANTRPSVRGTDHGIWRRMRLIPWNVIIPSAERDKTLAERLVANEASGILAWLVRGCLEWRAHGLGAVPAIDAATEAYRAEQDLLGRWLDERCTVDRSARIDRSSAYHAFRVWSGDEGLRDPWTASTFYGRITEGRYGISHARDKNGRYLVGVKLRGHVGIEAREPDLSPPEASKS